MRALRARLQDIRRLLKQASELEISPEAVRRLRWLLFCLEHGDNVSLTCRHFGIARSTFLRWAHRFDLKNLRSLDDSSKRPHTVRQSDVSEDVIAFIRDLRMRAPTMGKTRIAEELRRQGAALSSATVGRIIERHGFFFGNLPSHRRKRAARDGTLCEESGPQGTMRNATDPDIDAQPSLFPMLFPESPLP